MNPILFATCPKYDDGTEYLSYYASLVLKEAEKLGISTKEFENEEVVRSEILKFIKKQDPQLIFINGHGDDSNIYGYADKIIFSIDDINLLKDRIVYARACHAGLNFGKFITGESGCFIGYKYPFSFLFDLRWSAKPSNDNVAKLYLEPSNENVLCLIKGKSTQEAYEKSKSIMIENMKKILRMEEKKELGAMGMLKALWNNYEGQVIYGNKFARFI